jgi:hypothetical protein
MVELGYNSSMLAIVTQNSNKNLEIILEEVIDFATEYFNSSYKAMWKLSRAAKLLVSLKA